MRDKTSWFIQVWQKSNPSIIGIGECGPLPGLSIDAAPDFGNHVAEAVQKINEGTLHSGSLYDVIPARLPSLRFGLETALLDLQNGGQRVIYQNELLQMFSR